VIATTNASAGAHETTVACWTSQHALYLIYSHIFRSFKKVGVGVRTDLPGT